MYSDHVVTFQEDSFDFLLEEGLAKSIFPPKVFYVLRAGVRTFRSLVIEPAKDIVRLLLKRKLSTKTKMILYEIERAYLYLWHIIGGCAARFSGNSFLSWH